MTKDIFLTLKNYEHHLYTAKERNYVMFGSYEVKKKMADIYEETYNKKSNMLNSCGSCALREMKALAVDYFDMKKNMELQETKKNKKKKTE